MNLMNQLEAQSNLQPGAILNFYIYRKLVYLICALLIYTSLENATTFKFFSAQEF